MRSLTCDRIDDGVLQGALPRLVFDERVDAVALRVVECEVERVPAISSPEGDVSLPQEQQLNELNVAALAGEMQSTDLPREEDEDEFSFFSTYYDTNRAVSWKSEFFNHRKNKHFRIFTQN